MVVQYFGYYFNFFFWFLIFYSCNLYHNNGKKILNEVLINIQVYYTFIPTQQVFVSDQQSFIIVFILRKI